MRVSAENFFDALGFVQWSSEQKQLPIQDREKNTKFTDTEKQLGEKKWHADRQHSEVLRFINLFFISWNGS